MPFSSEQASVQIISPSRGYPCALELVGDFGEPHGVICLGQEVRQVPKERSPFRLFHGGGAAAQTINGGGAIRMTRFQLGQALVEGRGLRIRFDPSLQD